MLKNKVIFAVIALLVLGVSAPVIADADTTAPVVNLVLNPASPNGNFPWYITAVDAGISATDDLDPAPAIFAMVDQSPTSAVACDAMDFFGGGSILIDGSANGAQGVNYLHVCAKDASGNMSTILDQEIDLDTVAPVSSASAPATSANTTFAVQMNATEATNPALSASLYVRKDGGAWQIDPATLNGTMGSYSFDFTPSGDGTYDFYTIATDDAGNTEVKPETVESTTVVSTAPGGDVTPPTTTLVMDAPDGNNGWYISQPVITFSVSDPDSNTANGSTLYCVDTTLTCVPNTIYSGPFQLPSGVHYVQFWSEDESTNSEAVQQYALNPIKIDEAAPVNQSVVLDGGLAFSNTGNVVATLNQGNDEPVGIGSDISTCELSTNGGTTWTDVTAQTTFALNSLTNGPVSVLYRCTDDAGNVSANASDNITVEIPSATTPAGNSSGGGGGGSSGGGFLPAPVPNGQVLGAFTLNPNIFEELLRALRARRPAPVRKPVPTAGVVLGAFTTNPAIQILEDLARILKQVQH